VDYQDEERLRDHTRRYDKVPDFTDEGEVEGSEGPGCLLCELKFKADDEVEVLSCGHSFHTHCLRETAITKEQRPDNAGPAGCPHCRKVISKTEREEIGLQIFAPHSDDEGDDENGLDLPDPVLIHNLDPNSEEYQQAMNIDPSSFDQLMPAQYRRWMPFLLEYARRNPNSDGFGQPNDWVQFVQASEERLVELRGVQHEERVIRAVTADPHSLGRAPLDVYKSNAVVVMAALLADGMALQYADSDLQGDFAFVLAAVHNNGLALRYADSGMKSHPIIVELAVENNGMALEFASTPMKSDLHIAHAAIFSDPDALEHVEPDLQKTPLVLYWSYDSEKRIMEQAVEKAERDPAASSVATTRRRRQRIAALEAAIERVREPARQQARAAGWTDLHPTERWPSGRV